MTNSRLLLRWMLRMAGEGVHIRTGNVRVMAEFVGHFRRPAMTRRRRIIPNQLIIPIPAQRFDDIQPRFDDAVTQTRAHCGARSSRPGRQRWRARNGRIFLIRIERQIRTGQIVDDFLVQMIISSVQIAAGIDRIIRNQLLRRCRQLATASTRHPWRSGRGRRRNPTGFRWHYGPIGHNGRVCNAFLLLLLLLLALKIFNDFQHAMRYPRETSGSVLLIVRLFQFTFRQFATPCFVR